MLGWHFLPADGKHRYDKRTPKQGETLSTSDRETPRLCHTGLHASKRLIDALRHAPGPLVQRVDVYGDLDIDDDKFCGRHRTTLIGPVDATDTLRRFARLCALGVIHLWDPPEVVVRYLKTGDENIRAAAWDAAWGTAWATARDAARAAAEATARGAAKDAAKDATWGTAWGTARDAAMDAAWGTAWNAAWGTARDAAKDAAWATAWGVLRTKQNRRLTAMISALMKKEGK